MKRGKQGSIINVDECLNQINFDFGLLTKYTKEFIKNALELSNEKGLTAAARELNISKHTLYSWRKPLKNKLSLQKRYNLTAEVQRQKAREQYRKDPHKRSIINGRSDRKRYHKDPEFRIRMLLRTRIWRSLKDQTGIKTKHTAELVGCSWSDLVKRFELQFQEGMTWDNQGKWHIDHVIPCSKFNLTKIEDQLKCYHYTNLKPCWNNDNLVKSNKLPTLAFINCASQKKTYTCAALQMYDDSPMFRMARDYVTEHYDKYYILSARLGLVDPFEEISPYEHTVMFSNPANRAQGAYCLSVDEKHDWAQSIFKLIDWSKFSKIHFYVGKSYWEPLEPLFKAANIQVERFELPQGVGNVINAFKEDNLKKSDK